MTVSRKPGGVVERAINQKRQRAAGAEIGKKGGTKRAQQGASVFPLGVVHSHEIWCAGVTGERSKGAFGSIPVSPKKDRPAGKRKKSTKKKTKTGVVA